MQALQDLAEEYLANVAALEARIAELQQQERQQTSCQARLLLHRRITILYQMAGEGRQTAFEMQHYYDKPERGGTTYEKPKPTKPTKRKRERVRFSKTGYGPAAPAAAMHGRNTNPAPVSGLRAQLSRGYAAKRNSL